MPPRRGRTVASAAGWGGRGRRPPGAPRPTRTSPTITRSWESAPSSRSRNGRQRSRSSGVGRFPGGAQRFTALRYAPRRRRPSSTDVDDGRFANPARCSAANRKSPERSPVKIRPVRLPPCAAGASPRTRTRARGSPNPGTGRPQYGWSAKRATFSRATCSRQATSLGHRRHTTMSLRISSNAFGVTARRSRCGRRCRNARSSRWTRCTGRRPDPPSPRRTPDRSWFGRWSPARRPTAG